MKITQITISAARTINLGNYESLRVEGSCTIELDKADVDLAPVRKKALDEVKTQMNETYKKLKPNK